MVRVERDLSPAGGDADGFEPRAFGRQRHFPDGHCRPGKLVGLDAMQRLGEIHAVDKAQDTVGGRRRDEQCQCGGVAHIGRAVDKHFGRAGQQRHEFSRQRHFDGLVGANYRRAIHLPVGDEPDGTEVGAERARGLQRAVDLAASAADPGGGAFEGVLGRTDNALECRALSLRFLLQEHLRHVMNAQPAKDQDDKERDRHDEPGHQPLHDSGVLNHVLLPTKEGGGPFVCFACFMLHGTTRQSTLHESLTVTNAR